jgi:energy-coupling factor transporter transmembrane protein EcfT
VSPEGVAAARTVRGGEAAIVAAGGLAALFFPLLLRAFRRASPIQAASPAKITVERKEESAG